MQGQDRWIRATADHVWVRRAERSTKTTGGVLLSEKTRKDFPLSYGIVVATGPLADKIGGPGNVVFFAEDEVRPLVLDNPRGDHWDVMPAEAIYGWCTVAEAQALGLDFGEDGCRAMVRKFVGDEDSA